MTVLRRVLRRLSPAAPGAIAIAFGTASCRPHPACDPTDAKGCVIEEIRIDRGPGAAVSEDDIEAHLATAESSFFVTSGTVNLLGGTGELFFDYQRFDRLVLERDLERIQRYYHARGFYEVMVRAARVLRTGGSTVRVLIEVREGPPTILTKVELEPRDPARPLPAEPPGLKRAVDRAKGTLPVGERFEEEPFEAVKGRIVRALTDRGYAYATVTGRATVDRAKHEATATYTVDAGPPCTFGPISIEGHGDLPEDKLRAVIDIEPGEPFSTEDIDRAQLALGDTGVLGSVSVDVARSPEGTPPRTAVPVRFLVQKAALRSIVVGGGAELGSRVRAHLVTSWEHRNFLGEMRRLFVDARAGVHLHPLTLLNWDPGPLGVRPLPELSTAAELRQPGFLERRTVGNARIEARFFVPDSTLSVNPQDSLPYENLELHGTAGVERPFWKSRVRLGGSLNGQFVSPFLMYGTPGQPALLPGFDWILMPYLEGNAVLDLRTGRGNRPDPIHPRNGFYAGANLQVAWIFPESGWDIRVRPELRAYRSFGDVTFAFRVAGGFLFPFGYGQRLFDSGVTCPPDNFYCTGNPCADGDEQCKTERIRSLQLSQLRGFYSGGLDTNRGYTRNGVNPQEEVVGIFQAGTGGGASRLSPIGGRWLWEAQIEMRFPIYKSFGGSVFLDSGDAWYGPLAFRPHLSAGFGLRYATPIGPLRADVGVRIPCAQVLGTCEERPMERGGQQLLLGLPVNVSIAVGNPF